MSAISFHAAVARGRRGCDEAMSMALRFLWSPKETLRARLQADDADLWPLIVAMLASPILGIRVLLTGEPRLPPEVNALAVFALCPVLAVPMLLLQAHILMVVGRWFGGTASAVALRAALGWPWLPIAISVALWLVGAFLQGHDGLGLRPLLPDGFGAGVGAARVASGIDKMLSLWAGFLALECVFETLGISRWRATVSLLLSGLAAACAPVAVFAILVFR